MTSTVREFDDTTAITPSAAGRYLADLDPDWTVVGNPNGGYLQAIMARAAAAESPFPHVLTAATHFLRAPRPDKVVLDVETLRIGRNTAQVRVRLGQDDVPQAETVFTLGELPGDDRPVQWASDRLPAAGLPFEDCPRFLPPREVFPVELMYQLEVHLEPGSLGFTQGAPRGLGELRGWLRLPGHRPFDPFSLLLAADVFPPATFDIEPTGWVPTIEMSTYVRALPAPGPVQIVLRADLIHGDRVDETCTVRDGLGRIVAQSRQLAGIRFRPA
jgi:hypothetical protein